MRVPLGHAEVGVPHQLLNRLRTRPEHRQVRAEGVAEAMDAAVGERRQVLRPLHQPPDAPFGEWAARSTWS